MRNLGIITLAVLAFSPIVQALDMVTVTVEMRSITPQGLGPSVGSITAVNSSQGVVFTPILDKLPPGMHGFHVHENPACEPGEKDGKTIAGGAAGSHYDPAKTGKHLGPSGEGHLGDMPQLEVKPDQTVTKPVVAPRLKLDDLKGRALIIHAEADNYADKHGGDRIACGVVER
jgi:Cu-Zn family superoxide dismutase